MGAAPDHVALACGVLLHKGIVAAAVSSSLWHGHVGWVSSFAAASPLGLGVGWALTHDLDGPAAGVVAAVAGGTFLHVAVAELLFPAWKHAARTTPVVVRLGMIAVGLTLVWLVAD